ncbi:MAG: hypothetical protein P8Y70_14130, partial [Candidatus Lokiarchaeota archaeon]
MEKYRLKEKKSLILLLSFVIMFLLMDNALAFSDDAYSLSLTSGAKIYQVERYNKSLWNSMIGSTSDPKTLFGGDANVSGARYKLVSLDRWINDFPPSVMFSYYFFRWLNVPYYPLLNSTGYNFTYINERYQYYYYKIWDCQFEYWNFTTTPFQHNANYSTYNPNPPYKDIWTLRNPSDYSRLLHDYNDFA